MTAADGVVTTLPGGSGLNPFYGTSAAAPHAGAIAALMKQGAPNALPATITNAMKSTALDIMAPGPDKDSGAGIVQAFQAVQAVGGSLGAMVRPTAVNVVPNGNTVIERNECNTLNVPLINEGPQGATAVSATITTSTPGFAMTRPTSLYPNLAQNGGTAGNSTPFELSTSKSIACPATASFLQTVTFTGGVAPRAYPFTIQVGTAPNYTFAVQPSVGFPAGATGPLAGSVGDDALFNIPVPAGFNFMVYGTAVNGGSIIRATPNGNIQIQAGGGSDEWDNVALPAGTFDPVPVIMPFWDDLRTDTVVGGGVYTNLVGVAPNRQFIVEWRGRRWDDGGTTQTLNFGVVFTENSSAIEFRYPQTNTPTLPSGGGATVGIQNAASPGQFTQYSFNSATITNGLVLRGTLGSPSGCNPVVTNQCSTPLFADVPPGYWAAREINTIYNNIPRITNGCLASPLNYCPTDIVTRDQMAAFLIRALEGEPSPTLCAGGSPFTDVPAGSIFCPHIVRLVARGITLGCGGSSYCPTQTVTRDQMAAFLVRAVEGEPNPNLCAGGSPFTDVPAASLFCPYIVRLQGARHHPRVRRDELLPGPRCRSRPDGGLPDARVRFVNSEVAPRRPRRKRRGLFSRRLLVRPVELVDDPLGNAHCCVPIAVRGGRLRRAGVVASVVEQAGGFLDDRVRVAAYESRDASRNGLRPFRALTHDEHRLAECGCLFLNAARVRDDETGIVHQRDERRVWQRLDDANRVGERGHRGDRAAHFGVGVRRIDDLDVRMGRGDSRQRLQHALERRPEILPAVRGDDDQSAATRARDVVGHALLAHVAQRIDHRVAGDGDACVVDAFLAQVVGSPLRRREVNLCHA
jgi:hypothetical protein